MSRPRSSSTGSARPSACPEERTHTLKERALHPLRHSRHESFAALKDVSFEIAAGRVLRHRRAQRQRQEHAAEVPGRASTESTTGRIWCNGRMSTFIELGVGFNPDLAALDNVVMNGIMLGLNPREARSRYEQIIEFAELEEFQDLKLKNYSSGMHVRLAFSVAIQVDADILLIDEVLAVGDAAFQQKCFDVFNRMRDEGRTIVFVTHDMGAVNRFCHRALAARARRPGRARQSRRRSPTTTWRSTSTARARTRRLRDDHLAAEWAGSDEARILEAWTEDALGKRQNACVQGDRLRFKALVAFARRVEDPAFSVEIEDDWGTKIFVATTAADNERSGISQRGRRGRVLRRVRQSPIPGQVLPDRQCHSARRRSRRDPSRAADVDDDGVRIDRAGRCRGSPLRHCDRALTPRSRRPSLTDRPAPLVWVHLQPASARVDPEEGLGGRGDQLDPADPEIQPGVSVQARG